MKPAKGSSLKKPAKGQEVYTGKRI